MAIVAYDVPAEWRRTSYALAPIATTSYDVLGRVRRQAVSVTILR